MIASAVLCLVVLELGIRMAPRHLGLKAYADLKGVPYPAAASDYLPFTTPAGKVVTGRSSEFDVTYAFNALGYIGPAPASIAKDGRKRVLLVGDSFTLGWGVNYPQTFAALLQAKLGTGVEVINAAYHGGYSPDAYYAYLKREGRALAPDVVVVVLCQNDVNDLYNTVWDETDETGAPTRLRTTIPYTGPDGQIITGLPWHYRVPVVRDSYLASLAFGWMDSDPLDRTRKILTREQLEAKFAVAMGGIDKLVTDPRLPKWPDLIVGVIPAKHAQRMRRNRLDQAFMMRTLEGLGLHTVDLEPILAPDDYFVADGHFSPKGHQTVADVLAPPISWVLQ